MNNKLIFCLLTSVLQVGVTFSADSREICLSFNLDKIAKIGLGSINRLKETKGFLWSYPLKTIVPVTLVGGLRYGAYPCSTIVKKSEPVLSDYSRNASRLLMEQLADEMQVPVAAFSSLDVYAYPNYHQDTKNPCSTTVEKYEPIYIKPEPKYLYRSETNRTSGDQYSVEQGIDTKAVSMGGGDFITIAFNEKSENKKSIFSFGFGGCTGTILYCLLKNGEQRAALTHYPPTNTPAHLSQIRQLSNRLKGGINCNEIIKTVGVIFHPIGWVKNLETGYYFAKGPSDANLVDRLKKVINEELPNNSTLIEELYDKMKRPDEYHPGGMFGNTIVPKELEIVLSPNPEESYFHSKATRHKQQKLSDL